MNELEKQFNENALVLFQELAENTKLKKQYEEKEKAVKEELSDLMEEYAIKSIDNQYVKITRVAGSASTTVDLKTFKEKEPKEYDELVRDYPKTTVKKPYLTFKVK